MAKRAVWMTVVLGLLVGSAVAGWPTDPMVNVPLCNAVKYQGGNGLTAVPTVAGGVIAAWQDDRDGDNDVYAQRVDSEGEVQWTVDGVPVCTAGGVQAWVLGVSDGAGGAIIVWIDTRDGEGDLYAQRLNSGGPMWTTGGVVVSAEVGNQKDPAIGAPTDGSVVIAWRDGRAGESISDIYSLEIVDGSSFVGPPNGLAVSTADYGQWGPVVGTSGFGDAVIVWPDGRNIATGVDIYAQGVFLTVIFADGFESGDVSKWNSSVP